MKNFLSYSLGVVLVMALSFCCLSCSSSDDDETTGNGNNPTPSQQKVPTPDAGNDLYGIICDNGGNPLKDIVVSDGYQCVATDSRGFYQMKRNGKAEFVSYSIPAGYKAKSNQFYQKLSSAKEYDFKLDKLADRENHFYLVAMADPQVTNNKEISRFTEETLPDLKAVLSTLQLPVYGICLGDIVNNKPEHMRAMKTLLNSTTMPMFPCIGNHDKDPQTDKSVPRTTTTYTSQFGPLNYSFNRGKVHFICLDNIIFSNSDEYVGGFSDEQVEWMRQDLQYVPKNNLVIVYYHIPIRNSNIQNRDAILSLLKDFNHVKLMCGHTHYNQNFQITTPIQVEERITGAACGAWWHGVICADGTPNGYAIYEINGNEFVDNYYKSTRFDRSFQIRLHHGDATFGGDYGIFNYNLTSDYVVANIWNYDPSWHVGIYEDDVYMGEMTYHAYKPDAWAGGYMLGVLNRNPDNYSPTSAHEFVYKLHNPHAKVRVVATDGYGNTYTQTDFVSDIFSAVQYQ